MKRKLINIIAIITSFSMLAIGCGNADVEKTIDNMSKKELQEYTRNLESMYNQMAIDNSELNTMYQALSTESLPTEAISVVGDGTGRYTFNSVDSKIIFPASFQYPEAKPISANGSIDIVNNVSVTPGSNWIMKLNGATLELEHSSDISGIIKVAGVTQAYNTEKLQTEVLEQWFINMPEKSVSYRNVFIENTPFGVQAYTPTMIDSENAVLICGMVAYGEFAVTYVFVYRGDADDTKNESIRNVINTVTIMGNEINVSD